MAISKRYSVSRSGMGGRPRGKYPKQMLPITCTDAEYAAMLRLSTRDRALAVLEKAKDVVDLDGAAAVIIDGDGAHVINRAR